MDVDKSSPPEPTPTPSPYTHTKMTLRVSVFSKVPEPLRLDKGAPWIPGLESAQSPVRSQIKSLKSPFPAHPRSLFPLCATRSCGLPRKGQMGKTLVTTQWTAS